jgi:hypothetical protein
LPREQKDILPYQSRPAKIFRAHLAAEVEKYLSRDVPGVEKG